MIRQAAPCPVPGRLFAMVYGVCNGLHSWHHTALVKVVLPSLFIIVIIGILGACLMVAAGLWDQL